MQVVNFVVLFCSRNIQLHVIMQQTKWFEDSLLTKVLMMVMLEDVMILVEPGSDDWYR